MNIGISGHQNRPGIDWDWVSRSIRSELEKVSQIKKAYSCLAVGSDQIFANVAQEMGIPIVAVIPLEGYESFFDFDALQEYRRLLDSSSERIHLRWNGDPGRAFFEAGKFLVDCCGILFAVWDGKSAEGVGGTADIVTYAQQRQKAIVYINPSLKRIACL